MSPMELKSVVSLGHRQLSIDVVRLLVVHNNLVVSEALPQMLESGIDFYIEHTGTGMLRLMFRPKHQAEVVEIFKALEEEYAHWEDDLDSEEE